jgi:hypothetical protein
VTPHTSSPYRRARALAAFLGVVASVFVALAVPGTAMASECGDKVLADWFDNGRIDRLYQAHCYEEAIDAIPADLRDYANAEEIISRALQASLRGELDDGGPDPTPGDDPGGTPRTPGTPGDPNDPTDPGTEATPEVDTTGISSVPIPLLVLGGMSIALLAAGGLGYLSRRRAAANGDDAPPGPDDFPS